MTENRDFISTLSGSKDIRKIHKKRCKVTVIIKKLYEKVGQTDFTYTLSNFTNRNNNKTIKVTKGKLFFVHWCPIVR